MAHSGGCLCGSIRYQLSRSWLGAAHCYCSMCRRAHGTAYSTHVMVRPDQLVWLQGADELQRYQSSATGFREFCRSCGSHLLVHGQTGDGALAIPAGTLDGDPELHIQMHIFTADCVSWHQLPDDGLPRHAAWPPELTDTA